MAQNFFAQLRSRISSGRLGLSHTNHGASNRRLSRLAPAQLEAGIWLLSVRNSGSDRHGSARVLWLISTRGSELGLGSAWIGSDLEALGFRLGTGSPRDRFGAHHRSELWARAQLITERFWVPGLSQFWARLGDRIEARLGSRLGMARSLVLLG